MAKKSKIRPVRRKNEFSRALKAAKQSLKSKTKQRDTALSLLRDLNIDIPNLERTCRALEAQLNGKGSTGPDSRPTSQGVSKQVGGVSPKLHLSEIGTFSKDQMNEMFPGSTGEIPPEIRAQLPPEDFSKFGSHFGDEPAESEDFLPEITGKELVPEKKP